MGFLLPREISKKGILDVEHRLPGRTRTFFWLWLFLCGGGGHPRDQSRPSLSHRATSGIGKETARVLALRGATVIIPCRTLESGRKVKESILEQNLDAKIDIMEMDLSSLDSVGSFARAFNSSYQYLNILINNAGIMACPFQLSKDGVELQFSTNHLGKYAHFGAYSHSKLANIWHANELSHRLQEEGSNVTANSLHPGAINTNLCRYLNLKSFILDSIAAVMKPFVKTIPQGAATTCHLALHPGTKDVTGKYFVNCNEALPSLTARDKVLSSKFWDFSQELIKRLRGEK